MKSRLSFYILTIVMAFAISACDDEDSFTVSPSNILTFSMDTVKLDTVFSTVPSSTRSFWVYNKSGDGLRCSTVRLENGNQTGFRVNVDGVFLSSTSGYQVNDIEIRNKDSIRVFVEVTTPNNNNGDPRKVEDNLVFTLESGVQQKVNLNAYSWDADLMRNVDIQQDATIGNLGKPVVIYGGLTVSENATLTIAPGTTLYFHGDAAIDVHGRLVCQGTADNKIVLRGDRLDRMFDYLPYDNVSGQWQGLHFHETSYDNLISHTDIHSTFDGVVVDSSDVSKPTLTVEYSMIYNCQGTALSVTNSNVVIRNTLLANTLDDCLFVDGGIVNINNCTLAQFYPFDANRGSALRFSSLKYPLHQLTCRNSLITGYAQDEMTALHENVEDNIFNFDFSNCIIRTPKIMTDDSLHFVNVTYEEYTDTVKAGKKHFRKIDTDNLRYDFSLDSISPAIDKADVLSAEPLDINGSQRDDAPDIGAYEYKKDALASKKNRKIHKL